MKRLLVACLLITAFSTATYAQKGSISVNGGVDVAMPVGDWSDAYGIGIGATVKGLYGVTDDGKVGLTLGYIRFGIKTEGTDGVSGSMGIVPVMALYRHSFGDLYVEPQVGFSSNRVNMSFSDSTIGGFGGSTTSFAYAAGVGYMIGDIDLSARYQGFSQWGSSSGFAGLRVAYNFAIR